jgi:uncharacterized protein YjbI with pentapeptide repeats
MTDTHRIIKLERTRRRLAARDVDMSGSTFSDVNLSGAAFDDVNLAGATIHNANLSRLRISDANLSGASINGIAVEDLIAAYRAANPKAS